MKMIHLRPILRPTLRTMIRMCWNSTYTYNLQFGNLRATESREYLNKSFLTTRFTRSFAFTIMLIFAFVISRIDPYCDGYFGNDG